VLGLVMMQGGRLAAAGLLIGVGITIGVTRMLRSLLLDVSPTDFSTIAGVSAMLAVVAMLASLIPAYRATRIDPILAIRHE
jgi:ABC-type antimicrobial peptide transport system permease subunit